MRFRPTQEFHPRSLRGRGCWFLFRSSRSRPRETGHLDEVKLTRAGFEICHEESYGLLLEPLERVAGEHSQYGYHRTTVDLRQGYGNRIKHRVVQDLHQARDLPLPRNLKPPNPSEIRRSIATAKTVHRTTQRSNSEHPEPATRLMASGRLSTEADAGEGQRRGEHYLLGR